MSSASIYYKFKSARTPSRIAFDGTGISVWDLKREIMLQNKMGKGTDFDLQICSAENDEGEWRSVERPHPAQRSGGLGREAQSCGGAGRSEMDCCWSRRLTVQGGGQ